MSGKLMDNRAFKKFNDEPKRKVSRRGYYNR